MGTVVEAWHNHWALILSPDDFWMAIAFAVSQFLQDKSNAEKYRDTFVHHQGKMKLSVDGEKLGIKPKSAKNRLAWREFVDEICSMVAANTKVDITNVYVLL